MNVVARVVGMDLIVVLLLVGLFPISAHTRINVVIVSRRLCRWKPLF